MVIFSTERFTAARKMKGISFQKLADKMTEMGMPITKQALSKYNQGDVVPSHNKRVMIAKILGQTYSFFSETNIKKLVFGKIHWNKTNWHYRYH